MIFTIITTIAILGCTGLLLRVPGFRHHLRGYLMYGHQISAQTMDLMIQYLQWYPWIMIVPCLGILIGFIGHWPGWIGAMIFLTAATLIIPALCFKQLTAGLAKSVVAMRRSLSSVSSEEEQRRLTEELEEAVKKVMASIPQDQGQSAFWSAVAEAISRMILALFHTSGANQVSLAGPRLVHDTAKGILDALTGIFNFLAVVQIWVMVIGMTALIMPNSAPALWVFALFGFSMLIAYNLVLLGEWKTEKILKSVVKWSKIGVIVAIAMILLMVTIPIVRNLAQSTVSHILITLKLEGQIWDEETAKEIAGDRPFDQRPFMVRNPGYAYYVTTQGVPGRSFVLPRGAVLFKTEEDPVELFADRNDKRQFGIYYLQSSDGLYEPSTTKVYFPEGSARSAPKIELKEARAPYQTLFYLDSLGVASGRQRWVSTPSVTVYATNRTTQIMGQKFVLCAFESRGQHKFAWGEADSLKF